MMPKAMQGCFEVFGIISAPTPSVNQVSLNQVRSKFAAKLLLVNVNQCHFSVPPSEHTLEPSQDDWAQQIFRVPQHG